MTDRYTHHVLTVLETINKTSQVTLQNLVSSNSSLLGAKLTVLSQFDTFTHQIIGSNAGVRSDLFNRPLDKTLLTDFFGGVSQVELSEPLGFRDASGVKEEEEDVRGAQASRRNDVLVKRIGRETREQKEVKESEGGLGRTVLAGGVLIALQVGAVWVARSRSSHVV